MNDRLNNDMFGKKYNFALPLLIVGLILLLVIAFASVKPSHAMTSEITAICDTVDGNQNAAYNGHNMDSSDAQTRHCTQEGNGSTKKEERKDNTPSTSMTVIVTPPVIVPPVVIVTPPADNPPVVHTHAHHCNNGEGNGSEGCSPSTHGNNDENSTTPSQDAHNKHNKP